MSWVVTNGKNYLNKNARGVITATTSANHATQFAEKNRADDFLKNLPKAFRNLRYFSVLQPEVEVAAALSEEEETVEMVSTVVNLDIDDSILDGNEFLFQVQNFQNFVTRAHEQKAVLVEAQRRTEAELADLEHAIEFSKTKDGYKLYKMFRDARLRRRKYKDAIIRIDALMSAEPMELIHADVVGRLRGLDDRHYTPRALPELFVKAGAEAG